MPSRTILAVILMAALLAGCASPQDPPTAGPTTAPDGNGPAAVAAANGTAPVWTIGQWWDHKWFLGSTATEAFTVKTIVAEDKGESWVVATDNNVTSAIHAAFLFPTLGDFPKGEVTAVVGDFRWPWYQFPLSDNLTWTSEVSTRDGSGGVYSLPLVSSAKLAKGIVTAAGVVDGFDVEARTAGSDGIPAGRLFARYDYVPTIGWMSHATFYDVLSEEGEAVPQFILELSDSGAGYTGPFFESTSDVLSTHFNLFVPTSPTPPSPTSSFPMTAAHTHLFGFLFSFAAAGAHDSELVAPDGRHWGSSAVSDGNSVFLTPTSSGLIFVPAAPGDWHVFTAGAGAFAAGGGIQAYGVTQREGQV
ncbi:MAG: hypothetical protein ACYC2H_02140 [Thermoplasmatota archaeon]